MTESFNDKHLLWWVFKLIEKHGGYGAKLDDLPDKEMLEYIGAPEWVLPAMEEKLAAYGQSTQGR